MLAILAGICILSFVVFIHELGHFLVAKRAGISVEEFGFGLPPRIVGKKIGDTVYSINVFPFGGFVRLFGESSAEEEDESLWKPRNAKGANKAFYKQIPWKRFAVLIAGIAMNFLLGFLIIWFLFTKGTQTLISDTDRQYATDVRVSILTVTRNSPAGQADFKTGDAVFQISAQGYTVYPKRVQDVQDFTRHFAGQQVTFVVNRGAEQLTKTVMPRVSPPKGEGALGVELGELGTVKYPFFQAGWLALKTAFETSATIFKFAGTTFKNIILKGNLGGISGPVGIVNYAKNTLALGTDQMLSFVAMISLNLAAVNLWPIPAFDGGRLAFVLWEWLTKKPVPIKWESIIHTVGMVALIALLILVTIGDIRKLL